MKDSKFMKKMSLPHSEMLLIQTNREKGWSELVKNVNYKTWL
jgi:hypothetical protein